MAIFCSPSISMAQSNKSLCVSSFETNGEIGPDGTEWSVADCECMMTQVDVNYSPNAINMIKSTMALPEDEIAAAQMELMATIDMATFMQDTQTYITALKTECNIDLLAR